MSLLFISFSFTILKRRHCFHKEIMKEITKRYTNPFLSDEENEKLNLRNQELEFSKIEDDSINNCEDDKLINPLALSEELYTDKDVLECYKEGDLHVKDICVDEGKIDTGFTILEPSNDHMNIEDDRDEGIEIKSDKVEDLQNSIPDCREFGIKEEQISSSMQKDEPLSTLKSLLESVDQQLCQSPEEKISKRPVENITTTNGNTPLNLNKIKPTTTSGDNNIENLERVNEPSIEPQGAPRLQDVGSVNGQVINPVHRVGEGESSFSVAGPISGSVTYSGHVGFSGSISLRSDSSTTSTRSFTFPILQSEWNTSPVRMAKADRRGLRKHHRGWKHGLLCFRF